MGITTSMAGIRGNQTKTEAENRGGRMDLEEKGRSRKFNHCSLCPPETERTRERVGASELTRETMQQWRCLETMQQRIERVLRPEGAAAETREMGESDPRMRSKKQSVSSCFSKNFTVQHGEKILGAPGAEMDWYSSPFRMCHVANGIHRQQFFKNASRLLSVSFSSVTASSPFSLSFSLLFPMTARATLKSISALSQSLPLHEKSFLSSSPSVQLSLPSTVWSDHLKERGSPSRTEGPIISSRVGVLRREPGAKSLDRRLGDRLLHVSAD